MKDLYRRNKLAPRESDRIKIHNCEGSEQDKEAAFSVLLNGDKKAEYDRAHLTLSNIGYVRRHLGLAGKSQWRRDYGDFLRPAEPSPTRRRKKTTQRGAGRRVRRRFRPFPGLKLRRIKLPGLRLTALVSWPVVIAAFLALLPLGYFAWQERAPVQQAAAVRFERAMYSTTDGARVYATPDRESPQVAELAEFQEVFVDPDYSDEDWAFVDVDGSLRGFVAADDLNDGSGEQVQVAKCREYGVWRPESGQHLESGRTGNQQLTADNTADRDALVKFKDHEGQTQVLFYLRAGESAVLKNMPPGRYQLHYALGENFSPACTRFLDNMEARRDPRFVTFGGADPQLSLRLEEDARDFERTSNQDF